MNLSIVIPSHNEGTRLLATIQSVLDHTHAPFEIIVVDDNSDDQSGDYAADLFPALVKVIRADGLGAPGARNLALQQAKGEYVAFLDAHILVQPGWSEPMINMLRIDSAIGIAIPAVSNWGTQETLWHAGLAFTGPDLEITWLVANGQTSVPLAGAGSMMVRRQEFIDMGSWAACSRWALEDIEMSLRYLRHGLKILACPEVRVQHYFRETFPYEVSHVDVTYSRLRLAMIHFGDTALAKIIEAHRDNPSLGQAIAKAVQDETMWSQKAEWNHLPKAEDVLRPLGVTVFD